MLLAGFVIALATAATLDVAPGDDLAATLRRAKPGDTLALARGRHQGSLPGLAGLTVTGAGAGETVLEVPEGSRGAVVVGAATLTGLTVRAGPRQCALVVDGGEAVLRDVALAGGACGALVASGALHGEGVHLRGGWHGLLVTGGEVRLTNATVHGGVAGVAVQRGRAALDRSTIFGPSREAAVTVTGGEVTLLASVVISPGPAGLAVSSGALRVRASAVSGSGTRGGNSTCAEALGGELRLAGSELRHCGGAALEASRARVVLDGVDVEGGAAGCLALLDGTRADLQGVRCSGRGPGLFVGSGAQAELRHDRWLVDPTMVVECATGARVRLGAGEAGRQPCPGGVAPPDAGH